MGYSDMLDYLILHRGEPECEAYLAQLAREADNDIVKETLMYVCSGDREDSRKLLFDKIRKNDNQKKRDRKLSDRKQHYEIVNEKQRLDRLASSPQFHEILPIPQCSL